MFTYICSPLLIIKMLMFIFDCKSLLIVYSLCYAVIITHMYVYIHTYMHICMCAFFNCREEICCSLTKCKTHITGKINSKTEKLSKINLKKLFFIFTFISNSEYK